MAQEHSFDIVAEVDFAEVQNALNIALKQIASRYDFKGKVTNLELDKGQKQLVAEGSNDGIVEQMMQILNVQLAKRGVDLRALSEQKRVPATGGTVRVTYAIRDTMNQDECKEVTKAIKEAKLKKIRASIQGDSVRISGPSLDDLQAVQTLVRELKLSCPIKFTNYK